MMFGFVLSRIWDGSLGRLVGAIVPWEPARQSAKLLAFVLMICAAAAQAQSSEDGPSSAWTPQAQPNDDGQPSATAVRGSQYPRVFPDGRVAFRVIAPQARTVQIRPMHGQYENNGYSGLGKKPYDMVRAADGSWMVTTPPVVPGFHDYQVVIDGMQVADPSSKAYGSGNRHFSGVEVPQPGVDFYDIKDVPHGNVRMQWHRSNIAGVWRRVFVYTPPGYDGSPARRYPVLYLRHGGGQDETGWTEQGHANFILDNLIAAGKAVPMLVVMDSLYFVKPGEKQPPPSVDPPARIVPVMVDELVPFIDANFRTIPDREHRALAGLSGGSVQTLFIGLRSDAFSALGMFSRRPMPEFEDRFHQAFVDAPAFNRKMKLLWWGAGTAEEGIYNGTKATLAYLDKLGIKSTFVEFPGTSHEWQTWRKSLYDFAPRLFRQ